MPKVSAAQVSLAGCAKREQRTGDQQLWWYQITWRKEQSASYLNRTTGKLSVWQKIAEQVRKMISLFFDNNRGEV